MFSEWSLTSHLIYAKILLLLLLSMSNIFVFLICCCVQRACAYSRTHGPAPSSSFWLNIHHWLPINLMWNTHSHVRTLFSSSFRMAVQKCVLISFSLRGALSNGLFIEDRLFFIMACCSSHNGILGLFRLHHIHFIVDNLIEIYNVRLNKKPKIKNLYNRLYSY